MFALAIWMAVQNDRFRAFEARLVTPVAGFFTGSHAPVRVNSVVFFALGTSRRFGLDITDECTSALLLIPLLVMMGSFAVFTRLRVWRELVALLCGAGLILLVNTVRIAGIAWATWKWGLNPGYTYSHIFVGSAFSLVGFVASMLLALWILVRGDRPSGWPAVAADVTIPASNRKITARKRYRSVMAEDEPTGDSGVAGAPSLGNPPPQDEPPPARGHKGLAGLLRKGAREEREAAHSDSG